MKNSDPKLAKIPAPPVGSPFTPCDIAPVNHKPHPYTVGPWHVAYAADHHGGIIDQYAIEQADKNGVHCAYPRCRLAYAEHTCDTVLVIEITGDFDNISDVPGLKEYLFAIKGTAESLGIDGFVFTKGK